MKTILASLIALGFAGAASASTVTPAQADTSVTGYCAPYYRPLSLPPQHQA
ncbi:MAG: hypothetical protein R3D44_01615 [Hyphomicrobiaceae bacterium]